MCRNINSLSLFIQIHRSQHGYPTCQDTCVWQAHTCLGKHTHVWQAHVCVHVCGVCTVSVCWCVCVRDPPLNLRQL
jgi:hypothetical protein